ncbi:hypothetical protein [Streptomyces sp. NPDC127072]|uniref:hypothetical protein n=1 Tax=Streptomyces sp. NPDC127072 TaxID=3347129 RepID=UPI003669C83C
MGVLPRREPRVEVPLGNRTTYSYNADGLLADTVEPRGDAPGRRGRGAFGPGPGQLKAVRARPAVR